MASSKTDLRARMARARDALSPEEAAALSEEAVRRLLGLPEVRRARSVFTYVASGREVDTRPLIRALLGAGKVVSVPLVFGKGRMEARRIRSLEELEPGRFGILAPPRSSPLEPSPEVTVCPGLAFTERGDRLGRGGAYYDAFLAEHPSTFACGLAYEFQVVEEIPREASDRPLAAVVTERRTIRAAGPAETPLTADDPPGGVDPDAPTVACSRLEEAEPRLPPAASEETARAPGTDLAEDAGRPLGGRYDLGPEIGRGGIGAVLRAFDREIGRDVAVKLLLDVHRGDPDLRARLVEEARIAGRLQHPGVVPVYDLGLVAADRPYFAMKLVEGKTLSEILAERRDLAEGRQRLVALFEQVCQTLAYAHARGVIHRDLKPANVMVGAFGEVQVMDWGLAKAIGASEERPAARPGAVAVGFDAGRSAPGSVLGTPAYLAPEQARGEASLDERCDVFGLGAILCEILTGRPPYSGRTADELYRKARAGDLEEAFRRLRASGADREVVDLALECLAPERKRRPRDAREVARRARAYLDGLEERARRSELRAARARFRSILAALSLVAVLAGGTAFLWVERRSREREAAAAASVLGALEEARGLRRSALADGGGDLSAWDAALREARRAVDLCAGLRAGPLVESARRLRAEIEEEFLDRRTVARLETLREETGAVLEQADPAGGRAPAEGPDESLLAAAADLDREFREVFRERGLDLERRDPEAAAGRVRESAIARELILGLDQWAALEASGAVRDPELAERLFLVAQLADADVWSSQLRNARAASDVETLLLLSQDEKILEAAPSTLDLLARAFRSLGLRSWEEEVLRRAQRRHAADFWLNARLGGLLASTGRPEEALRFLSAAAAVRPRSGYARYLLGLAWLARGDAEEAFEAFRKDVELEPASPRSYAKLWEIVETRASKLSGRSLEALLETLEAVASSGARHPAEACGRLLARVRSLRGR